MTTSTPSAEPTSTMGRDSSSTSRSDQGAFSSSPAAVRSRQSYGSSDAGESSTTASQRDSLLNDGVGNGTIISGVIVDMSERGARGTHRSHRSRNSGGFLLSNSTFERPADKTMSTPKSSPPQRRQLSDYKGKSAPKSPETKHKPRNSNLGLGLGNSPLAGHVSNAGAQHETPMPTKLGGDAAEDQAEEAVKSVGEKPTTAVLEVDAAQIVNLALNLGESRRNASRRITSGPLPPPVTAFTDNIVGSSMRYHMQQQQRRFSRNVSPKPDRGEKATGSIPRSISGRLGAQFQPVIDMQPDGTYQYQFSASTIARADKAKRTIELMAQYRKLLDYVPPLKPLALEKSTTRGTIAGSPTPLALSDFRRNSRNTDTQLGRPYNPLQYIRNRKVRARNSRSIDGEEQGFGDLNNVCTWVEEVSRKSSSYTPADCLLFPPFPKLGDSASLHASPQSTLGRSNTAAKIRRPRIDWITNPADMLADVYWLEQDDNKKLVEDRHGRTIFPRDVELRRTGSGRQNGPDHRAPSPKGEIDEGKVDFGQATGSKLPDFKSIKPEKEKFPDLGHSKARQKLRDVRDSARIHHSHNTHSRDIRGFLRARSKSDSNSSDSEIDPHPTRRRRGTADSQDRGKDILEKQMEEMLAEESKDQGWGTTQHVEGGQIVNSAESQNTHLKDDLEQLKKGATNHSRSASVANRSNRNSHLNGSSGRASLEVPGSSPRGSLEDLDYTAPNSPERKAKRTSDSHVPSIAMDLSSPRSRHSSQTRRSGSNIEVRLEHDRRQDLDWNKETDDDTLLLSQSNSKDTTPESLETLKKRQRSISPSKKISHRKTDDSVKSLVKGGSIRRTRMDDSSGIRGFLKSARNPVSRVGDMLWKKDRPPGYGAASSSISAEDSDSDTRGPISKVDKEDKRNSTTSIKFDDLDKARPRKERPSYLNEMPVFTSPFDNRGRQNEKWNDDSPDSQPHSIDAHTVRETRRLSTRARLLDPAPRIDVYSPLPSPDLDTSDGNRRQSSSSAQEPYKGSFYDEVKKADSRLDAVLGYHGKRGRNDGLPITGLASLETAHDLRPSLRDKRQWSISDRTVSAHRGPMTKREIARVQALLLSSGIKAKELSRRAAALTDLREEQHRSYVHIAELSKEELAPVPKSQEHLLAARILSDDIQLSSRMWQDSADTFCNTTITELLSSIESLQSRLSEDLTPMTRKAADEADEFSKDLVTSQTLKVQRINDKMEKMFRARRRRFRWLRRGGWVLVEWTLVGVMWYVWFMVMVLRIVMGIGSGVVGSVRWLFFA